MEPQRGLRSSSANGSAPEPGGRGPGLPVKRLYSRRHAMVSLLFWLMLVAVFTPLAIQFTSKIQSTLSGTKGTASENVRINVVKNFSTALAFPTAIVWDAKGVPAADADAAWKGLLDAVRADSSVNDVTDGSVMIENWPREDWHAAFVAVGAKTYGEAEKVVPNLRADVAKISFPGASRPWVTGGPALFLDLNIASTKSLRSGELIALPVAFVILLLVFRSLVAAFLPVMVATLGVVCTLGILCFLATPHDFLPAMGVTFFVPNLVTMIGLGVGIDYCLIYLARYRRERANHLTTQEALLLTRQTAGKTVLASAVLVMSGFLTLLFIPLEFFTSIAVGGMLVVACVALATLTLLPAMIFLVGPWLEWGGGMFAPLNRLKLGAHCFERWGQFVVPRAWGCVAAGLTLLAILAIPFWHIRIASVEAKNIPSQSESRKGYESLSKNLGAGWMMPAIILVQHPTQDWMNGDGLAQEKKLVEGLARLDNTEKVLTVTDNSGSRRAQQIRMGMLTSFNDPSQSIIMMLSRTDPQSLTARKWLGDITKVLKETETAAPDGPRYYLGGLPSVTLSADTVIMNALPTVILATLASTFVLLTVFMRSLLISLKAIILNLFCVMAAYGFQVICFQDGWGARLFHLFPTDGLNTVVLVICFCALFGLSMDYEVFILSAVRESWLDNHNIKLAVQEGLLRVAGIITSAAFIMIAVFLSFAFGDVVEIEQLGVGLSFAVLLDATIIRLLLVPGVMTLMGRWAFWCPGHKLPVAEKHPRGHHYQGEKLTPPEEVKRLTGL
ncbi:MAG TPA: MMPL family transporter [Candidatus Methylacidiphilales bacterium]|nr:MMPL family transporter [Candidatus Methylacidiphilales bacterium]